MARTMYSTALCRALRQGAREAGLAVPVRDGRYEPDDVLEVDFTTVWPEEKGHGRFRVLKFVGGGFAGQVYRCALDQVEGGGSSGAGGLREGGVYAVKIMVPPTAFSRGFRDFVYWIGFQAPFSAQVSMAACRAGLLWQKAARIAAAEAFGREDAVADVYASFHDGNLGACGEIREWVEGRVWRLEPDTRPRLRGQWRTLDPALTESPEYVAKRQFMFRFVRLLHEMGAVGLARQYEWWTLKSQPNTLKRTEGGPGPADGLCAVDFRAGLALLPFLPMSPGDVALIVRGLARGAIVQFDRCDLSRLRDYVRKQESVFREATGLVEALSAYDEAYRRSMPDITRQGVRLLLSADLRASVRRGLADSYSARGLADASFARAVGSRPFLFPLFHGLSLVPFLGRFVQRVWGDQAYREDVRRQFTSSDYLRRAARADAALRLIGWHRSGRTGEARTRFLWSRPWAFWTQRFTLGLLPPSWHRALAEPGYVWARIKEACGFVRAFYRDAGFREKWLSDEVRQGCAEGMLDSRERDEILARVGDPFIVKYLKCLAVHFATLPVSEITWTVVGIVAVTWKLMAGADWATAVTEFGKIGAWAFFALPVSPGSLCRGFYVLYLMIRERDFRNYMIAAPISFIKIVGYLAFPIQMVATYPALSRFMASRWATGAVGVVPVFGEKGALLEHMVFDVCFNFPRTFGLWARERMRGVLDVWLLAGLCILLAAFGLGGLEWSSEAGVNLLMAVVALFVLPRVLFYPMLRRRRR